MEIQATKAYFEFLENAGNTFDELLNSKKRATYHMEEVKSYFSTLAFENVSRDFILEVKENMEQYESSEIVWDSLKIYHGVYLEKYRDDYSNTQIHQAKFETAFLLGLWANIKRSHSATTELMCHDIELKNQFLPFPDTNKFAYLDKLRSGEIKTYFSLKCKTSQENEVKPPEKDPRLDFEQFKKEAEQIADLHDREEMVNKRLNEFRMWTNIHDVRINNEDYYTHRYYPNFKANCAILIDDIQQSLQTQIKKTEFEKQKEAPLATKPRQKLVWSAPSRDFVKTFHNLIIDKKISLNGNYDIAPIVRILLEAFNIPAEKGKNGFMKEESIQTYFRKEHNGEPY